MSDLYPRSLENLPDWAESNGLTIEEARRRFAQFVVLCGVASVRILRDYLVFKGGNALDFVLQPNRSTTDLDFSLDMDGGEPLGGTKQLRDALTIGLRQVAPRFGVALAVHSVTQQPPGKDKTFITYRAKIGYALPDQHRLKIRMANNHTSPHVLPIDISINEPIVGSTTFALDDRFELLRISTLEDIVGEKLRSLLQQPIRNRTRKQDLLDIAVVVRANEAIDRQWVATALRIKAEARNVPVTRTAFRNPEVIRRAGIGYAALQFTTRTTFIPFDEALAIVLAFVDDLPIPEV